MLNEADRGRVWEYKYEAEVRSYYFADLASRYTKKKQRVVGLSFVLSSAAAASLWAELPWYVAAFMALVVASLNGYSIAVGLDKAALTTSRLHASWNKLASDYELLLSHSYEDDAESIMEAARARGRDISEQGSTDAPYNRKLMDKWQDVVHSRYTHTAA